MRDSDLKLARSGHTLFEVVVVVVVLVVVGFVSLPLIQPMFGDARLQAAEDMVKARWTDMKRHALTEGRVYLFGYKENSGSFRIAPEGDDFWGDDDAGTGDMDDAWVFEGELPEEVLFCQAGSKDVPLQASPGQGWTKVLTFMPDGTARENVGVVFGKSGGSNIRRLKVEGVLGAVSSEKPAMDGNPP